MRTASIERKTKETNISVEVNIDGTGQYDIKTGIGFLDHMLEQLSKHSLIDIKVVKEEDAYDKDDEKPKKPKPKKEDLDEDSFEEACWVGYKQVGLKNKGGKQVPNCVPEEKDLDEKEAKTKPSIHTQKYKKMYGEGARELVLKLLKQKMQTSKEEK